jgi:cob(I)alamin adenosyltransferase
MKGYVQIYTGNGKGKTTAAIGLAVRAAGAGLKIFIGQFIKMGDYSEIKALKERFSDLIILEQFGSGGFIGKKKASPEQIQAAVKGLEQIKKVMSSGEYDVIICEEVNVAVFLGLLTVEDLLELVSSKPENVEIIFTGRDADPKLIEVADLVTEMREIKHYYKAGVKARIGIEK